MGRYLVSARNLKAGEVVITEKPIVIGPCGEPVCLGCYIPIPTRSNQYKLVIRVDQFYAKVHTQQQVLFPGVPAVDGLCVARNVSD